MTGINDFIKIIEEKKRGRDYTTIDIRPDFCVLGNDIMVKGSSFYAFFDIETGAWSYSEKRLIEVINTTVLDYYKKACKKYNSEEYLIKYHSIDSYKSGVYTNYKNFIKSHYNNYEALDTRIFFDNHKLKKSDLATTKLTYHPQRRKIENFNKLFGTLFDDENLDKIKWLIGLIATNNCQNVQKLFVFYGSPGTGKSTLLNLITSMFSDYTSIFNAKELTSRNNQFALAPFANNSRVVLQHDGDLSRIEDNTLLNTLVSHEEVIINEKFKTPYPIRFTGVIIMASNKYVKITDSKSGMLRRLVDISPSNNKVEYSVYTNLVSNLKEEYSGIVWECIRTFEKLGIHYYDDYRPFQMINLSDPFFDFILENKHHFKNGIELRRAVALYKSYCSDNGYDCTAPKRRVSEQLGDYFNSYSDTIEIDGEIKTCFYHDFKKKLLSNGVKKNTKMEYKCQTSYIDVLFSDCKAQYSVDGIPRCAWDTVTTKLKDIDSSKEHYVLLPKDVVVVDMDIKDGDKKSYDLNVKFSNTLPKTYGELSRSGLGIHLYYTVEDKKTLQTLDQNVEIKRFGGKAAIRRRFSYSNGITKIAKAPSIIYNYDNEVEPMLNDSGTLIIKTEKTLRTMIERALAKAYHPDTSSNVDFICRLINENDHILYDLSDLKKHALLFAANSTNQSTKNIEKIKNLRWCTFEKNESNTYITDEVKNNDLYFFDIETLPNATIIGYKKYGDEVNIVKNPTPEFVTDFIKKPIVGFNNRKFDNHILYGIIMGYSPEEIYELANGLVNYKKEGKEPPYFMNAFNISHADIYDFTTKKQSLKKWEIELGLVHDEYEFDWAEKLDNNNEKRLMEYLINDVNATEGVFINNISDYETRKILAHLSGLTINHTNRLHIERILFGEDREPQVHFNIPQLNKEFPKYRFEDGVSYYGEEKIGEGGFAKGIPGHYKKVYLFDVESMHPNSAININYFGKYTENYKKIIDARLALKHGDIENATKILDTDINKDNMVSISNALKIVINSVYGLSKARFNTRTRSVDNVENVIAKRGALFMCSLMEYLQELGIGCVHIKTDSIKIPVVKYDENLKYDYTQLEKSIESIVYEYAKKYGYTFKLEAIYDDLYLINDAFYAAKSGDKWSFTGTSFLFPFVQKLLFKKEPITISDLILTKQVNGRMFIGDKFIGRIGTFVCTNEGEPLLKHLYDEDKHYFVSGTKGYLWSEAKDVTDLDQVNMDYYISICKEILKQMESVKIDTTEFRKGIQ